MEMTPANQLQTNGVEDYGGVDEKETASQMELVDSPKDDKSEWFGCLSWRPKWLQVFNRVKSLLVFMFIYNTVISMVVNGLIPSSISSLEKRFQLTSTQTGIMTSSYDMATVPVLLIMSYIGVRYNRPRILSIGVVSTAIGSFLFTLPHFITGLYEFSSIAEDSVCGSHNNSTNQCADDTTNTSPLSQYLGFFIAGNILHGIGYTPMSVAGITYLDDWSTKEQFSLYVSIYYAAGVLGPALGFIGGGVVIDEVYTDFDKLDSWPILPSDTTRWVGAWWPAIIAASVLELLMAAPFLGFPRNMPGKDEIRKSKVSEAHGGEHDNIADDGIVGEMGFGNSLKEDFKHACSSLKLLFLNPVYVLITLEGICEAILISGFAAFAPKYIANQFALNAGIAAIYFGAVTVPGATGGTVLGGYVIKRFRMSLPQIFKLNTILLLINLVAVPMFFIHCPPTPLAGVIVPYSNSSTVDLNQVCSGGCDCDSVDYSPICGLDELTYYSPCHAGCESMILSPSKKFTNCNCIGFGSSMTNISQTAEPGICHADCSDGLLALFLILFFFAMILTFGVTSLNITELIRCIPSSQRSFAIGINWIFLRLLGTIPGPVLFGAVLDKACLIWESGDCDTTGACQFYDTNTLGIYMVLICGVVKVFSTIFITICWRVYRPPKSADSDNIPSST